MGLPQMIQSRVQFGSRGAVIPLLAATLCQFGFAVFFVQTGTQSLVDVTSIDIRPRGIAASSLATDRDRRLRQFVNAGLLAGYYDLARTSFYLIDCDRPSEPDMRSPSRAHSGKAVSSTAAFCFTLRTLL
jgi:hypothetical protein